MVIEHMYIRNQVRNKYTALRLLNSLPVNIIWNMSFIIIFCFTSFSDQNELNQSIKNESTLQLVSAPGITGASKCKGALDSTVNSFYKTGISSEDLLNGVFCTAGDFDGNGYLDFAIWFNKNTSDTNIESYSPDYKNYLILFFHKNRVVYSIIMKTEVAGSLLVHYPPRIVKGENGEPVSKNDALWEIGETDGYDDVSKGTVYIYNSKKEMFEKTKFGKQ